MIYVWPVVILVTSTLVMFVAAIATSRPAIPVNRLADPAPLPYELARAGRFDVTWQDPTFGGASQTGQPPDTGPLLIMSEHAAALASLERETARLVREAEAKIPPRWRT